MFSHPAPSVAAIGIRHLSGLALSPQLQGNFKGRAGGVHEDVMTCCMLCWDGHTRSCRMLNSKIIVP